MSFSPIIPNTGLQGWAFLSRTLTEQKQALVSSGQEKRLIENFGEKISKVSTAEDLVKDRELLSVALTAFGLEADIDNKFLIQKVLEEGAISPEALANRFSDRRYLELTKAFGFGDFDVPRTVLSTFSEEILDRYSQKKFEILVGEKDADLRIALSFDREILDVIGKTGSETAKWLDVLGRPPLKTAIERALFLPTSFGNLDIDKQVDILKQKVESRFGSSDIGIFQDEDIRNQLRRNFLLVSQLPPPGSSSGARTALSLLQSYSPLRF